MKGKVKFFNEVKGFGFITADNGKDFFMHKTGIIGNETLDENDIVTFDVEEGDKGPKAVNIKLESKE